MSARFLLIRHAESVWSKDESRPLSPAGLRAAEGLSLRLSAFDIGAIYSSPYQRALQTVEPLASRLGQPIAVLPDLRERVLGAVPGISFEDAARTCWESPLYAFPGGETGLDAQQRILKLVQGLSDQASKRFIVIATHGTLLALLLNAFDSEVGFEFWRSLRFPDVFKLRMLQNSKADFSRY